MAKRPTCRAFLRRVQPLVLRYGRLRRLRGLRRLQQRCSTCLGRVPVPVAGGGVKAPREPAGAFRDPRREYCVRRAEGVFIRC